MFSATVPCLLPLLFRLSDLDCIFLANTAASICSATNPMLQQLPVFTAAIPYLLQPTRVYGNYPMFTVTKPCFFATSLCLLQLSHVYCNRPMFCGTVPCLLQPSHVHCN
jgi:hypothetical protein